MLCTGTTLQNGLAGQEGRKVLILEFKITFNNESSLIKNIKVYRICYYSNFPAVCEEKEAKAYFITSTIETATIYKVSTM